MRFDKPSSHSRRPHRRRSALSSSPALINTIKRCPPRQKQRSHRFHVAKQRAYREHLAEVARHTLSSLSGDHFYTEDGSGQFHDLSGPILRSRNSTAFYPHYSQLLAGWEAGPSLMPASAVPVDSVAATTEFQFTPSSTLAAAHTLWQRDSFLQAGSSSLGVLCSASPKKPGGAFLSGNDEQDECLVRQSTLYDALQNSDAGAMFYAAHKKDSEGCGLHAHAMLYSPDVTVFKDDSGRHIAPYHINVALSVPVNAGTVRSRFNIPENEFSEGVRSVMKERMARALRLFEERGNRVLVLGGFGVGQFRNSPDMIGEIWADLLNVRGAKFRNVFEKVVFAVPGKHVHAVENSFLSRTLESEMLSE